MEQAKKVQLNHELDEQNDDDNENKRIRIRFKNSEGEETGEQIELSLSTSVIDLDMILNEFLGNTERQPYTFFYDTIEIKKSLKELTKKIKDFTTETVFPITYHPQSLFHVRPVTRWSSSLEGHTDAVLSVSFSPDGNFCASGGGDTTVRFWDINTETPHFTCNGHKNWVLCIAWSPNGKKLASGSMDGTIHLWDPLNGKQIGSPMRGHKKWITSISWQPLHVNPNCDYFASSGKDGSTKIWNVSSQTIEFSLAMHTSSVTKVLWGGQGFIYTASEDRTIKVWKENGSFIRELKGHAHWVNTIAVHTDYALRTGCFDEKKTEFDSPQKMQEAALAKYQKLKGTGDERLVSGSDDFTLYLWNPIKSVKPVIRMTGHQAPVNHLSYSPDGRYVVSASFDKGLKLWDGYNGNFLVSFRGHVQSVYQVAWSADSRMFVSASKDTTLKVWNIKTRKLMHDLPGHSDEIYAVDWSPDGEKVMSGGKDKLVKIWKN